MTRLCGKWELEIALEFDRLKIKWQTVKTGFDYFWDDNQSTHKYFPDFYLLDYDLYIEVKGYERTRDHCKWRDFPHKLIIIRGKEIYALRKGKLNLIDIILQPVL